jgi:hypothetical protein
MRLFRRLPRLNPGTLAAIISILALMVLSYLVGAISAICNFPPAESLQKALTGYRAWSEREEAGRQPSRTTLPRSAEQISVTVDLSGHTFDGLTLYTTNEGPVAELLDMRGNVVHRWELPSVPEWKDKKNGERSFRKDQIHWFRCRLFPNGDLLAVCHVENDTPYGYGIVKLDKDSRLLWASARWAHHDVDIGEDGTIYALTQSLEENPPPGMPWFPTPYIADTVVILSPDGQEKDAIPILPAFRDSPYALTFSFLVRAPEDSLLKTGNGASSVVPPLPSLQMMEQGSASRKGDFLHTNSVRVLDRSLADKFPLFKPGQILLSLLYPNILAVLDPKTNSVVWASPGIWRGQHDAEFLDNGNLLLYDNHGSPKGSRVLEYDPRTQAISWCYPGDEGPHFRALTRGMKQRLPNGNTLIVDPDNGRLFEVTSKKECVWECMIPLHSGSSITGASRYAREKLTFLKGDTYARPQ